ncbi:MAG: phage tail protein [Chitinophagaceae bacterium]|nr:MAG: phage tail protein [Chitinophagaceae bacterium]
MAIQTYQTVNFHFRVDFNFDKDADIGFQSVTGLDSTLETESVKEGGENRFTHVVPVRRKYGPLLLKRGLVKPDNSKITKWLKKVFDQEIVEPRDSVTIILLNEEHKPLMHWRINNVWPISWKIGELNAEQGSVLIETLELNYNRLSFENL